MLAVRRSVSRRQTAQSYSLPAPIGGLNARDAESLMPETDAIRLDNMFPSTTSVSLRNGYTSFATFTGNCETVIVYQGASEGVFVAVDTTNDAIIDATSGGAISTPVVGGSTPTIQTITNTRYDYVNFANTSGQYIILVNGSDTPLQYDGTTWSASTMTGPGSTADLVSIGVYAERLWFIEENTFDVWYLAVNAITGAATRLNLGSLFKLGGSLSSIVTWSADTASELSDFIAFVSTEGEVVVFSGTDPASASTWARVAQFRVGRPVTAGNRSWTKMGADAVIMTADGLVPMAAAVMQSRADMTQAVTDKIRNLFNCDVMTHGAKFGWQVCLHPAGQKLFVNVPTDENVTSYCYVMNTQTRSWCTFGKYATSWNAFCLEATKDTLYFGTSGVLAKADTGLNDGGNSITADAKQAFSYFGQRGRQKDIKMMRPVINIDGPVDLTLGVNVDYADVTPTSVVPIDGNAGDPWEVAWDYMWTGNAVVYSRWQSARGLGYAIAPRVKFQASGINLAWPVTDFVYEYGGIL